MFRALAFVCLGVRSPRVLVGEMSDLNPDDDGDRINGEVYHTSQGGMVFLGRKETEPGWVYLWFRNPAGVDTKLCLPDEGMNALWWMYAHPKEGPFAPAEDQPWFSKEGWLATAPAKSKEGSG